MRQQHDPSARSDQRRESALSVRHPDAGRLCAEMDGCKIERIGIGLSGDQLCRLSDQSKSPGWRFWIRKRDSLRVRAIRFQWKKRLNSCKANRRIWSGRATRNLAVQAKTRRILKNAAGQSGGSMQRSTLLFARGIDTPF